MKVPNILAVLLVLPFVWFFVACEKQSSFDIDSAIDVRVKSFTEVGVQVSGNVSITLQPSNDTLNNNIDFMLAPGSEIVFSSGSDGEVVVNLDTLWVEAGVAKLYRVSEGTRVPEDRFCEVWPDRRECLIEPAPEEEPDGNGEGDGNGSEP